MVGSIFGVEFSVSNPWDEYDVEVSVRYKVGDTWVGTEYQTIQGGDTVVMAVSSNNLFYVYAYLPEYNSFYIGAGDNWRQVPGENFNVPYTKVETVEGSVDNKFTYLLPNVSDGYYTGKYWLNPSWNSNMDNVIAFETGSNPDIKFTRFEDEVLFEADFVDADGNNISSTYTYYFIDDKFRAVMNSHFVVSNEVLDSRIDKYHNDFADFYGYNPEIDYLDLGYGEYKTIYNNGYIVFLMDYLYDSYSLVFLAPDMTDDEYEQIFE